MIKIDKIIKDKIPIHIPKIELQNQQFSQQSNMAMRGGQLKKRTEGKLMRLNSGTGKNDKRKNHRRDPT